MKKIIVIIEDNGNISYGNSQLSRPGTKRFMMDCRAPSKWHRPKKQYKKFEGLDQWEVNELFKSKLLILARNKDDSVTADKIANGFIYNGVSFNLTLENRFQYKEDYDLRDLITFPRSVKASTGEYIEFLDASEYEVFYLAAAKFVRESDIEDQGLQDDLKNKTASELYDIIIG